MVEVDTATRCCLLSELYQVDRGKVFLSVDELVKCVMAIENVDTIRIDELTTLVTLPDEAAIAQLANSNCDDGMSWIRLNKRDLGWLAIAALEEIFRSQPPNAYQDWLVACVASESFKEGTFRAATTEGTELVSALLTNNFALHKRLKDDCSEHVLSLSASGLAVYLLEGVWGSYKTRAIFFELAPGYTGLPQVNLRNSMFLKLTFNTTTLASKSFTILEC